MDKEKDNEGVNNLIREDSGKLFRSSKKALEMYRRQIQEINPKYNKTIK